MSLGSLDDTGLVGRAVRRGAGTIAAGGCVSIFWNALDNPTTGITVAGCFKKWYQQNDKRLMLSIDSVVEDLMKIR